MTIAPQPVAAGDVALLLRLVFTPAPLLGLDYRGPDVGGRYESLLAFFHPPPPGRDLARAGERLAPMFRLCFSAGLRGHGLDAIAR